jgi:hypothetical protein
MAERPSGIRSGITGATWSRRSLTARLWGERYAGIDRSGPVFSSCGEADATVSVVPDDEEES